MKRNLILIILLLSLISVGYSQNAMGKWRTHLAYKTPNQIEQSNNKVFVVSDGTLYAIDKRDGGMEFYSKLSGLTGSVVTMVKYDQKHEVLLVFYQDGNIDFISANGVKNLSDFFNKQISGSKVVNDILFHNDKAYVATSFGILVLNMTKLEIEETYYIGSNASNVFVNNLSIHKDKIYAVTSDMIFSASINNKQLINYENWKSLISLPGSGKIQSLFSFGEYLILLRSGKLYKQDSNKEWTTLLPEMNFSKIIISNRFLQAYTKDKVYIYSLDFTKYEPTNLSKIVAGVFDKKENKFWFIGDERGVAKYDLNNNSGTIFYAASGPVTKSAYNMVFAGQKLFVVPGSKWLRPAGIPGNIMIYENNQWTNILNTSIQKNVPNVKIQDFTSVAVASDDTNHFFVTSASTGIYEFKNNQFYMHYDKNNSNIENVIGVTDYYYQWVDNCILDKEQNLWFTNDLCTNGIKVFTKEGKWEKLSYEGINGRASLGKILISDKNPNQKWVLSRRHKTGICIFNDNGTIGNQSDDRSVFYSSFNYSTNKGLMSITPNFLFCMAQDRNGVVWVGTNHGPLLFNNPSKAFDADFLATRIIIPRNDGSGLGDFLLENQEITAIAIDGANRKWLGTASSGIYLMSENGQETIHHFTTKNSPLTSDNIMSIAINPVTGEVFIGTDRGLFSYQSDAAEAKSNFENVHAYPNPVREDFTGIITITGLVEKTNVKITDTAGNLVCETISNGSIATWDGRNKLGNKVSTGVYLVICVSPDGEQSDATKILIVN